MFQKETAALLAFHIKDLRKGKYLIVSISRRDSRFFFSKIAQNFGPFAKDHNQIPYHLMGTFPPCGCIGNLEN